MQILFAAEGQAGHHLPPSHQPVDLLTPDGQQPGTPSSRCLSEPHNAKYEDFGEEPVCTEEMKEEDEDYLFEFDLDSHDSWETEDEEEGGACSGRVGE